MDTGVQIPMGSFMKESLAKGEHYDRLVKIFIEAGGNLELCPFDTIDYKYEGPELKDGEIS